jgi:galactose-1-phosphate uridylyltransferase
VAQDGIRKIGQSQPEFQYAYINWNYLPQSGAGLFHPHLQVVVEDITTSHKKVLEGINRCQGWKSSFWQDYLLEEIRRGTDISVIKEMSIS